MNVDSMESIPSFKRKRKKYKLSCRFVYRATIAHFIDQKPQIPELKFRKL